ncbi:hypothetical protein [Bacillus badius]|uniref:Uncharacterized protein n=1 Tax=Bacillus badius TaxID=1455 RepID=A0ABR5AXN6_BACBA|nr:hypothetical protein [Bacillus badius]KIL75935.1 hypothetical protein SD78_0037 [Bacillus badius]KIL79505.1 hypothetical protein SD77_3371 [Bacillus badius]MED4716669.1 hypothetical protein [Bacillus badius]
MQKNLQLIEGFFINEKKQYIQIKQIERCSPAVMAAEWLGTAEGTRSNILAKSKKLAGWTR